MSGLITEKCRSVHYHLPYRWQVYNGITWNDLSMMEEIERAYCDPKNNRYDDAGLLAWNGVVEPRRKRSYFLPEDV